MKRMEVVEARCAVCFGEEEPTLFGLCESCYLEEKVLPAWMIRLLFEESGWVNENAWRDYLDYIWSRRSSEDGVTAWTLDGPMWARLVLEAVS